jgi:2-haloacid dehalogenase
MKTVLAFDVYGTLIDTAGVATKLRTLVGDEADRFARIWREKQLEYSFRRGLMQQYERFSVCIADALEFTSRYCGVKLPEASKADLLAAYLTLPAFDDVAGGLAALPGDTFSLYAFSNGAADAVESLLVGAGIDDFFIDIVSVDEVGRFKPDPAVYRHFLARSATPPEHAWLISSNPFDILGAIAVGMRGAWVRRSGNAIFDPWRVEPTITVDSLDGIDRRIAALAASP